MAEKVSPEEFWRKALTGQMVEAKWERAIMRRLPHDPRCKMCNMPFAGAGARVLRLVGRERSKRNPRFCNSCERFAARYPGGAEVEMTLLFADVRGSTTLAETMPPAEFTRLMNRFYATGTQVLVNADAWIDKLVGDEVIAFFLPWLGPAHPRLALSAARNLLRATGHAEPGGPWLPVGAGVHTGVAYMGVVGSPETVTDITALGDAVNVTARLAAAAGPGEILVSAAAYGAAGQAEGAHEHREMSLKGRAESVRVHVVRVTPDGTVG